MEIDANLISCWIHSPERDSDEAKTYRRTKKLDDTNIVDGFELKSNGEFIGYTKSNKGKPELDKGHYQIFNDTIVVNFDDPYRDYILKIVSLDKDLLKVRKS